MNFSKPGEVAAATPLSRSFVLASLRALHLDPRAPSASDDPLTIKPGLVPLQYDASSNVIDRTSAMDNKTIDTSGSG